MKESNQSKAYLGTGWGFPPTFNNKSATVELLSGVEDIESSLHIILSTKPGERVMEPNFGCNLENLLFESLTTSLKTYMVDIIKTAILYFEPRIILNKVELSESEELDGVVLITLTYTVRTTNTRFNFVYPFYKNEGTEI